MTLKKIFVSRAVVDSNQEHNAKEAVFKVECDGREYRSNSISILGPSATYYDPTQPQGRRVWIETTHEIILETAAGTVAVR